MANKDVLITIKALDKTKKAFGGITKGLKVVAGAALNLKTAFVGVAGAAGIGLLIKRSLDATDALAKTATRIGTTTEALSRLHFAADISGVSTETLNMAMQRFTRRTAEAARGTGEAKDAIRELGLNANNLLQLDLDEQMIKLADAFGDVESDADKVRLAMKLFDSEGVALVQTLSAGSAGLRAMFKEAELLGAVMSTDAAKGVEDTQDALTRLKAVMGGVIDQFTAALAPALETIVTHLTTIVKDSAEAAGGFRELARQMVGSMLGGFIAVIEGAAEMANGIIRTINKVAEAVHKFSQIGKGKSDSYFASMKEEAEELEAANLRILNSQEKLLDLAARGPKGLGMADAAKQRRNAKNYQENIARIAEIDRRVKKAQEETSDFVPFGQITIPDSVQGILDQFRAVQEELKQPLSIGGEDDGEGGAPAKITKLQMAYQGATDAIKTFNSAQEDVRTRMESLTTDTLASFSDALTNAVMGTGNLKDAFKAMIVNMIKQLIQFFIIDKLTGGIASALFRVTGAVSKNAAAGGGTPFRGMAAIGGPVQSGSPYMVGERGPEMFVPNQSGSIIPNKAMGGGITVVNNVDARGSGADVDQKIKSAMAQSSQQTIITIQDLMRRKRFA